MQWGAGTRVLVAGGAGFVGQHLCAELVARGCAVTALDNELTGDLRRLDGLALTCLSADVCTWEPAGDWDVVFHLASPASPPDYQRHPLATLRAGSLGTDRLCALAHRCDAVFVLASTSEVYGEPAVHPQAEHYRGAVDPVGPRSMYDEAKRFAEALTTAWRRRGLRARIARIFNTYGPGMRPDDGRVVPTFLHQALRGQPLTVHGDGSQTRSFCYVDDLVAGLLRLAEVPVEGPVNLGNPEEVTVLDLAHHVLALTGSRSDLVYRPLPAQDPTRRCPDITRARTLLDWAPRIGLQAGLKRCIARDGPGDL